MCVTVVNVAESVQSAAKWMVMKEEIKIRKQQHNAEDSQRGNSRCRRLFFASIDLRSLRN